MKKIFLFFFPLIIYSQVGYVESDHSVYQFLDRLYSLHIIDNFNMFEKPLSRKTISNYLIEVNNNREKLNNIDKELLDEYLNEFEFDVRGTTDNYSNFYNNGLSHLLNDKEKYFYFYSDRNKFNLFSNAIIYYEYLAQKNGRINKNVNLVNFGIRTYGTFADYFGYYFKATNGTYFGNKNLAREKEELKYNFKFSKEMETNSGQNYFDFTEGFLAFENDLMSFKIGRDRENIGYGKIKSIIGNNAPPFDYINFQIQYKIFSFSYLHGKLLGNSTIKIDSLQGLINTIEDKYLVYHKLSINPSRHLNFGIGEIIVYSNRSFDLAYINPFNFYKSIEHSNQDRDNSILFIDLNNNSLKSIKIYLSLLIDDIDFGKLGTKWYGNKFLIDAGLNMNILYEFLPSTLSLQYMRIDPYFYSHHINSNNYSSLNYLISNSFQPNSSLLSIDLLLQLSRKVELQTGFIYGLHGSNEYDKNGNLIVNHGGNFLEGFRVGDVEYINFLAGKKEYIREINLMLSYEFMNNYYFRFSLRKDSSDLKCNNDRNTLLISSQILLRF